MSRNKVRWIAVLGTLAIAAIISVQAYWVYQLWDYREKEFSQNVKISLYKVARQIAEINSAVLPSSGIINQISPNYYVVNINVNFKADQVEYFLRQEFQKMQINEDFEFGIYDCSNRNMVYGNYISADMTPPDDKIFKSRLPTHEGFTYYFGVFFPTKGVNIIANMKWVFMLSLLLAGAIAVYVYSIFVIVRQNELSELQKDFINNMTHEFKTPLASIRLATNAISSDPLVEGDGRLTKLNQIVDQQNLRLTNHVERILQLAKLEKDKFLLSKENVSLNSIIKDMIPLFELRLQALEGNLHIDLDDEDPIILADKLHLTNVIDNLVDNAIKYSFENPDVSISTKFIKNRINLEIEDKGIGMNISTQKKIFQKFYRSHTGNIHNVKGFGLGLFYVKNICKAHGWHLQIESKPERGTIIRIKIPKYE